MIVKFKNPRRSLASYELKQLLQSLDSWRNRLTLKGHNRGLFLFRHSNYFVPLISAFCSFLFSAFWKSILFMSLQRSDKKVIEFFKKRSKRAIKMDAWLTDVSVSKKQKALIIHTLFTTSIHSVAELCNNSLVFLHCCVLACSFFYWLGFSAFSTQLYTSGEADPNPKTQIQQQLELIRLLQDSARRATTRLWLGLGEELSTRNAEIADGRRRFAAGVSRKTVNAKSTQMPIKIKSRFLMEISLRSIMHKNDVI